jgi:hypothetical protein
MRRVILHARIWLNAMDFALGHCTAKAQCTGEVLVRTYIAAPT